MSKGIVPGWKRWLSYLVEMHIESAPSKHNPHLYVSLRNGRFQLSTAHAVYSFEDLYSNFRKAFEKINFQQLPSQEVLVLGLGLGSIPYMLENNFDQSLKYTLVEIDENVLHLAEKYCLHQLTSPQMCIQADAYAFMMQNKEQYGMICMDIFLDDVIPTPFESVDFLETLKTALLPGGVLLYNRLYRQKQDKVKTQAFFEDTFRTVFPEATYIEVDGNWIISNQSFS